MSKIRCGEPETRKSIAELDAAERRWSKSIKVADLKAFEKTATDAARPLLDLLADCRDLITAVNAQAGHGTGPGHVLTAGLRDEMQALLARLPAMADVPPAKERRGCGHDSTYG